MPNTSAAKKANKQSLVKYARNRAKKRAVKETVKEINNLASEGKKDEAAKQLPKAYKLIDKAAKVNIIHKNKAARKKSQLAKLVA
jgi:small subunit ribosomal protein S20